MSLKKVFIIGLAAAGMAGMANAQSQASPVLTGLTAPPTDQITVTYSVSLQAQMTVTPTGLSGDGLLIDNACAVEHYANLGRVTVVTNYPYWDVSIEAQNGLKLTTGGTPPTPAVWGTNEWDEPVIITPADPGMPGVPLLTSGTHGVSSPAPDTTGLDVCLGIRNSGGWLTGGLIKATDSLSQGYASIARVVGDKLDSDTYNYQTGSDIHDDGFATPAEENGVIIYVSAGFDANTYANGGIKGRNAEGDYTETLTFTLIAGF